MKKMIALTLAVSAFFMSTGCTNTKSTPKAEPIRYTAQGRYYMDGTIITNDGNEWAYTISDTTPYDNMPIYIGFDDNGTPNDIYDDIILGVTLDITTSIYDNLEAALSDKFDIERDGNNIKVNGYIK